MKFNISEYPKDFIPAGAKIFVACDPAAPGDSACTVKGFYDPSTGELHVQDVSYKRRES